MIHSNILDAIGNTPLIRLSTICCTDCADIIVKYEGLNVGGSIKTRTAYNMILNAEKKGALHSGSIIVEPTSGNQGIGLALVGAVKGYKVKIIMPDSVSAERFKLVRQYGAEVITVKDEGDISRCIKQCLKTALDMAASDPNVFVPQQFENPDNPGVHRLHTATEILEDLGGRPIHGFCSGIGTGGTITGIGEVLRQRFPDVEIWAVEPENAAILSGQPIGTHMQMGIGDGIIPKNLNTEIFDDIFIVSDRQAIATAKKLALEGLLCGISGGSNVAAALALAKKLGKGKTVLTILPDTGERYFSTPLFEGEAQSDSHS